MLSDQNTAMNWNLSLMTDCTIVPSCKIKSLKHWKLYKYAYIVQESFDMTDKSYPPPCCNDLQLLYLSVTLYACAQRGDLLSKFGEISFQEYVSGGFLPVLLRWSSLKQKRVKCEANFMSSGSQIVKRLRRRQYDHVNTARTIGLVLDLLQPCTDLN